MAKEAAIREHARWAEERARHVAVADAKWARADERARDAKQGTARALREYAEHRERIRERLPESDAASGRSAVGKPREGHSRVARHAAPAPGNGRSEPTLLPPVKREVALATRPAGNAVAMGATSAAEAAAREAAARVRARDARALLAHGPAKYSPGRVRNLAISDRAAAFVGIATGQPLIGTRTMRGAVSLPSLCR